MRKLQKKYSMLLLYILICVVSYIMFFVPLSVSEETLEAEFITSNYPFAGDIVYKGQRIGASSELCVDLLFNDHDSLINVKCEKFLFYTRRTPTMKTSH